MRTIKFRGKSLETDDWVYGFLADGNLICTWDNRRNSHEVLSTTVGQFTGLRDKNGKEIYEGDIIRSTRNGFGGVVKWHKRGYFYICEDIFEKDPDYNGDYANLGSMLENHPYFEVIGNISDNTPERLKGGEI